MREMGVAAVDTPGYDVCARPAPAYIPSTPRRGTRVGRCDVSGRAEPTSISSASVLDMAPTAAAAAVRVWPLLLKGLDAVAAAQEPQPTLLKAAESRASPDWGCNQECLDRSLRLAGPDVR